MEPHMSVPTSQILAEPVASFLRHTRPDLNISVGIVAAELRKPYQSPALVMQAAWKLAGDLAERTGPHKTFGRLLDVVGELVWPSTELPQPSPAPVPSQAGRKLDYPVLPVGAAHCEVHDWCPPPPFCGACRSEQIAAVEPQEAA